MLVTVICAVHVMWGILLIYHGGALGINATSLMYQFIPVWQIRAPLYIVSGLLPLVVLWRPESAWGLLSIVPQQILLYASALATFFAIVRSKYSSGMPGDPDYILADQGVYIVAATAHAVESVWRFHRFRESNSDREGGL